MELKCRRKHVSLFAGCLNVAFFSGLYSAVFIASHPLLMITETNPCVPSAAVGPAKLARVLKNGR